MKNAVFALAVVAVCGCSPPPQTSSTKSESAPPKIVGAWHAKVQFVEGPFAAVKDLEFFYSFNVGGTMTESSNYDGAPPVPPAYGVWRETGPNSFEARYHYFNSKPPAKFGDITAFGGWTPNGHGELVEKFTMAADGDSFESEMSLQMFDASGKPIEGGGKAKGTGTRIRFTP